MEIKFKELNENDISEFNLIANWDNQNDIKYFIRPNFKEGEIEDITTQSIINGFKMNDNKQIHMIICDDREIGYISIDTDFFALYKNEENTSWIGICIGDEKYRGKGISKVAMSYLEEKSKELNQKRIELGVFEYNKRAIKLYNKMGYKKIGEKEKFIYYDGNWYSDIRMEKYI